MNVEKIALWTIAALIAAAGLTALSLPRGFQTPVVFPVFYQMVEVHEGRAFSANHLLGQTSFLSLDDCQSAIKQRQNPENYYCLKYESAKTIPYSFPRDEAADL